MSRSGARKLLGQIRIIDRMSVDRVESNQVSGHVDHDERLKIIGTRQLGGGLTKEIVNMCYPAFKRGAVVLSGIEQFDDVRRRRRRHRLRTVLR